MKVLNFGSCNIDFVYALDHIVRPGETICASRLDIFAGGKGLNQSVALAKAGAEVYHAGCIGEDGGMLKDLLRTSGVNTKYLKTLDSKCGHAIIQVNSSAENSIVIHPGANGMVTQELADSVLADFSDGDMLILQNEISNVGYIARKAHERGMTIMLNPSPYNESLSEIDYSKIDYLILNEIEAKEITGMDERDDVVSYFQKNYPTLRVVLTLGARGCVYFDADMVISHPAFVTDVKDTTAAGDTFTGYFAAGIAEGRSIQKILKTASCASAIAVSRNGAAPSIPIKSEVVAKLGTMKPREDTERFDRVRRLTEKYIGEHLSDARLENLASLLGYSPIYTGHIVADVMGKPFSKLLQDKRCEAAHELLLTTDLSVSEIVSRVGYENESFFRRIFKQKYGANPLACRKSERKR